MISSSSSSFRREILMMLVVVVISTVVVIEVVPGEMPGRMQWPEFLKVIYGILSCGNMGVKHEFTCSPPFPLLLPLLLRNIPRTRLPTSPMAPPGPSCPSALPAAAAPAGTCLV